MPAQIPTPQQLFLSDHVLIPKGLCRRYIHYILPIWQTILQGSRTSLFKKIRKQNQNLQSKENRFETRTFALFPFRKREFGLTCLLLFFYLDSESSLKILVTILYSFPVSQRPLTALRTWRVQHSNILIETFNDASAGTCQVHIKQRPARPLHSYFNSVVQDRKTKY